MIKPAPISFHRHVEIGKHLHTTIDLLWSLRREINESKRSPYTREAAKEVHNTIRQLDILRSDLENLLCTTGVFDDESITCNPCSVYYGPFDEVAK